MSKVSDKHWVVEAGRNRNHLVSVRTKCWHTRSSGLHRQSRANCVTRLSGIKEKNSGPRANWLVRKEGEKMEVDGEVDSKKKLDQRKKELVKQVRKIDEFTCNPRNVVGEQKEKGRQELQDIEHRRNGFLPEHQKMQKRSQKLQSLQDRKKQCQKNLGKRAEDDEDLRSVIEDSHAHMQDNGPKSVGIDRRSVAGSGNQWLASRS